MLISKICVVSTLQYLEIFETLNLSYIGIDSISCSV
jgi:hypothetical protein